MKKFLLCGFFITACGINSDFIVSNDALTYTYSYCDASFIAAPITLVTNIEAVCGHGKVGCYRNDNRIFISKALLNTPTFCVTVIHELLHQCSHVKYNDLDATHTRYKYTPFALKACNEFSSIGEFNND